MNSVLSSQKKARVVALGCGANISVALIRPGSSEWNYKIDLPYDMGEIDLMTQPDYRDTKYVSVERAMGVLCQLPRRENVVDIVITGKLTTDGEREGREHKFCWVCSNPQPDGTAVTNSGTILLPPESRMDQETRITKFVLALLEEIKRQDTVVVYPGSFDPMHAGHREIVKVVDGQKLSRAPINLEFTTAHHSKGEIPEEEIHRRTQAAKEFLAEEELGAEFLVTTHTLFWDKYVWLNANAPTKDFIFVLGDDIWKKHGESLKTDFGWQDEVGRVTGGQPNVQFLVFNRGENLEEPREVHPAIHPASWEHKFDDELLNISSTTIRESK